MRSPQATLPIPLDQSLRPPRRMLASAGLTDGRAPARLAANKPKKRLLV